MENGRNANGRKPYNENAAKVTTSGKIELDIRLILTQLGINQAKWLEFDIDSAALTAAASSSAPPVRMQ